MLKDLEKGHIFFRNNRLAQSWMQFWDNERGFDEGKIGVRKLGLRAGKDPILLH